MKQLPIGYTTVSTRTFTEEDVDAFATLSGDRNPIHLDESYAEGTRFGRPIVHGALVASLVSAALSELPGTVIYLDQLLTFEKPVYPGTTLTAEVIVSKVKPNGVTRLHVAVWDATGDKKVTGTVSVLIDSDASAETSEAEA